MSYGQLDRAFYIALFATIIIGLVLTHGGPVADGIIGGIRSAAIEVRGIVMGHKAAVDAIYGLANAMNS